jgi:exodeoxyribonuclease V alpha subunit
MNLKKKELHKALMLCNVNIKQEVQNLIYKYKDDFAKDYTSFQLIAPQKSTIIGTEEINKLAQDILNDNNIPFIDGDIKIGANKQYKRFKIKDKVIHTKNENWFVGDNLGFYKNGKLFMDGVQIDGFRRNYCHNVGGKDCIRILNGMVGIIDGYDQLTQRILVKYRYEDIEIGVEYQSKDLGSLHLGYCLTIHKLQGSEAKTVALIVSPSHVRMINNNLLYTGITRGKTKGYIVGSKNAFKQGLKKHGTIRQTMLPLLFDGLFWELDDLAKQSIVYDADEWTHGKSEKNLTMCSTKEDFAKFIDLENEAYS